MHITTPMFTGSIGQKCQKSAPLTPSHAEALPFRKPLVADTLSLRQAPHPQSPPRFGSAQMPDGGGGWDHNDPRDPRNFYNQTFLTYVPNEGPSDWNQELGANGEFVPDSSASQPQNSASSSSQRTYKSNSKYAPKGAPGETKEKVRQLMRQPGARISQVAEKANLSYSRTAKLMREIKEEVRCSPEIGPGNKLQIGSFHEIDERS
jgi:hypothetical protein